uniref:Cytochrome P450 3638D3 n=1 Tax=Maconellicoccus hirsutus TaxID=177089 RepID=A0AAT9UUV6_MACHI
MASSFIINSIKNSSMNSNSLCWKILATIALMVLCYAILCMSMYKWRTRRIRRMLNSFYAISGLPIIGSLYLVTGNLRERFEKLFVLFKQYRDKAPVVAWVLHIPVVVIGKYDHIQTVLGKSHKRNLFGIWEMTFGDSMFSLQGEKWRKSRRIITPAFSPTMMQQYLPVLNEHSKFLTRKLASLSDTDETFDISHYVCSMNLDTITKNMTGYELGSLKNGITEFQTALPKTTQMESMRLSFPLLFPDFMYKIYLLISGNYKLYETVHRLPRQIIQDKLSKESAYKHEHHENIHNSEATSTKTLLDLLLKAHNADNTFTKKHVQAEILNMIALGFESTTLTVSFVLLMLAMYPEIQKKVYEEIRTIYKDDDEEVNIEDMKELVYLEQCINETLRKFTVVPMTFREHDEDIVLDDKKVIPANCRVLVGFYGAHHDKRIFPNADEWDPEHFAPDAIASQNKQVFFPFGCGIRSCIGAKYAMMSIKIQLVHLLRSYRFTTDMKMQDIHLTVDVALRNDSGYWLKLWSRKEIYENGIKHEA